MCCSRSNLLKSSRISHEKIFTSDLHDMSADIFKGTYSSLVRYYLRSIGVVMFNLRQHERFDQSLSLDISVSRKVFVVVKEERVSFQ